MQDSPAGHNMMFNKKRYMTSVFCTENTKQDGLWNKLRPMKHKSSACVFNF